MIQLIGLRTWLDNGVEKPTDRLYEPRATSVAELFRNLPSYLAKIPAQEHWNLNFTLANCTDKKRQFKSQDVIAFDIDKIDVTRKGEYVHFFEKATGISRSVIGISFSGHGLHFIVGLKTPFTEIQIFNELRNHYYALCAKLTHEMNGSGLPGHFDNQMFQAGRMLRLPNTENRKPGMPPVRSELLNAVIEPQDFDLKKLSGMPEVDEKDEVSESEYGNPDTESVLKDCQFIRYCSVHPEEVNEPQWYALLTVTAKLKNGVKLSHEISAKSKRYSAAETDLKINHAINAKPRTCENINALWGQCHYCPHFEKVRSPISIKGPDFIETMDSGFFKEILDERGKPKSVPAYDDLQRYFEKIYGFKTNAVTGACFVWNGKYYDFMSDNEVAGFARDNFKPFKGTYLSTEFHSRIALSNRVNANWFTETSSGMLNFNNGVFTMDTRELLPHSPERGFKAIIDYDYEPGADCPNFKKYLNDVTQGDEAIQAILLEFMGYAFSNSPLVNHQALVMVGAGSNGKSTLLAVLRALAGEANYTVSNIADLQSETSRSKLEGKLFLLSEETPTKSLIDSSAFKVISGGGQVTARKLYKDEHHFRNRAKTIFACNELPHAYDVTDAYFRRVLPVPFMAKFSHALGNLDPFIEDKLLKERSGIFNLIVEGYHRFKNRGFKYTHSDKVEKLLSEYRDYSDPVKTWVDENLNFLPESDDRIITTNKIYASYKIAAERSGFRPVAYNAFAQKLTKIVPDYEKRRGQNSKGKRERYLRGVELLSSDAF